MEHLNISEAIFTNVRKFEDESGTKAQKRSKQTNKTMPIVTSGENIE